ncbi:hypothetical protein JCM8547_003574 [Rhodosporidiobolus lusitaniae]
MTTKDYVYSLPPELLTEIFKLAYTNLFGNGKGLEPSADSLISLPHVKNLALVYEHFSSRYTAHLVNRCPILEQARLASEGAGSAPSSAHAGQLPRLSPDWVVPEFDDEREYGGGSGGFTASSMHELIFQCKRGAVRIEGTAVEAAEVYRDWIQQVDDCLTWWAGEKGFSREVVEEVEEKLNDLFGCEAVEAWSIQNEGALHDAWEEYGSEEV